jgi:hypothetical protein
MSLHRTVTLLGFKKPSVKGPTITLDVVCGAGECLSLVITRALWAQINTAVQAARTPGAQGVPTKQNAPRCASDLMDAAWVELASGCEDSLKIIAARHGVLPGSLGNWARRYHPERFAALQRIRTGRGNLADYAAAGLPIPKVASSG